MRWMREHRASVIVGCGISYDHYDHCLHPYPLPFAMSSILLNLGHGPVSVGTGHLPVAEGINHRPFQHSMLLFPLPALVVK